MTEEEVRGMFLEHYSLRSLNEAQCQAECKAFRDMVDAKES